MRFRYAVLGHGYAHDEQCVVVRKCVILFRLQYGPENYVPRTLKCTVSRIVGTAAVKTTF